MERWIEVMIPLVSVLGAGIISAYVARRKDGEEASDQRTKTLMSMMEPLRKELDGLHDQNSTLRQRLGELEARSAHLESENRRLMAGVLLLRNQVVANGHTPVWEYTEGT